MKKNSIIFIFILSAFTVFGQERKDLAISISGGMLNTPDYYKSHPGWYLSTAFDYHISERNLLSVNYLAGEHKYFENILSNIPPPLVNNYVDSKGSNATVTYKFFSVAYKYKLINTKKLSLISGIGAGISSEILTYPYKEGSSVVFKNFALSDLAFPVTLEINYKVFKKWQIGLTSGFSINPDYPILAIHAGPKLTYILN